MQLKRLHLKGFRNFRDATIYLAEKSLIIGSNDIGKTNLLYALRILLDKNLSESDLEPKDSDFFAYELTNELEIRAEFEGVDEECVLSKLRENISDDGDLILTYRATRNPVTRRITYNFLVGADDASLKEIESRFYLRVISLKFIGSKRDLFAYIRQERKNLLQEAKERRNDDDVIHDTDTLAEIENSLNETTQKVASLTYINKATESLNAELSSLSFHNTSQDVIFDAGASDPSQFVDELRLASRVQGKSVVIGGDGRNNQIHLALWSARNKMRTGEGDEPLEVNLFCIEEPEAHLHPHQQRKLAQYLSDTLKGQVIITTHSPQVACQFPPTSVVRLYSHRMGTLAAGNGVNPFTETAFIEFGYRLNIIPAEAFFSDVVFLVEGPSEELFYKALAQKIQVDLDRLNISILMVDGVGFKPYVNLLRSLRVPVVIRTDNDIFKVQNQNAYRFAGVQRALEIYKTNLDKHIKIEDLLREEAQLQGFSTLPPPKENLEVAKKFRDALQEIGVYLSEIDLETDLYSALPDVTSSYFGVGRSAEIVEEMKKRKATFMFDFLRQHANALTALEGSLLAEPLLHCQRIAEAIYGNHANA